MRSFLILLVLFLSFCVFAVEKDRLAVMDVQDEDRIFSARSVVKVTDYIFAKFQETNSFWMVPMTDRDNALEQAIENTVKGSRKECVDEKCQLSLVAQLQANYLINTKIKKLYEGTCNITVSKFDVEKRAGVQSWVEKFDCTEKGLYGAIDGFNFGGKRTGSSFQEGKIVESAGDWEVGQGEETIVNFESDPAGAVVMVDGKVKCQKTPCSKMITQGKHEISMQLENYVEQTKGTDVKKGTKVRYTLEPDFGYLTVRGKYEVELKLDGEKIGKTPIIKRVINPGAHQIEHADGCYYQSGEKFQIKRGDNKEINLELNPKESAIKVTARDNKGNDIEADVFVDGKKVGTAPGTLKVPMCSKEVIVKAQKNEFKQTLRLEEKKVLTVDASFKIQTIAQPAKVSGQISSGLTWSKLAPNKMNLSSAEQYCENLNEDGSSDWRLPTISELRTLIKNCPMTEAGGECKVTKECLHYGNCRNDACGGCSDSSDGRYSKLGDTEKIWSSSERSDRTDAAWYVGFDRGGVDFYNKYYNFFHVRCVYNKVDTGLNTIGRSWSKKSSNEIFWDDAVVYCADLEEDGYTDWRLPTISELRSLIKDCPVTETGGGCPSSTDCLSWNECRSNDCDGCRPASSDGMFSVFGDSSALWSSSVLSGVPDTAWFVNFMYGSVNYSSKESWVYVRCVRGAVGVPKPSKLGAGIDSLIEGGSGLVFSKVLGLSCSSADADLTAREAKNRIRSGFKSYKGGDLINSGGFFFSACHSDGAAKEVFGFVSGVVAGLILVDQMIAKKDTSFLKDELAKIWQADHSIRIAGYKELQFIKETSHFDINGNKLKLRSYEYSSVTKVLKSIYDYFGWLELFYELEKDGS